jgi:hypothetical protein
MSSLRDIADALHLLPGVAPVARLWIQSAVRARLEGRAATIDEALDLEPLCAQTPHAARVAARHELIKRLALSSGLPVSWGVACFVALLLDGQHDPRGLEAEEICRRLRSDPETPRSSRAIWRVLMPLRPINDATDTPDAGCVSAVNSAEIKNKKSIRRY